MTVTLAQVLTRSAALLAVLTGIFWLSMTHGVYPLDWSVVMQGHTGTPDWDVFVSRLTRSGLAMAVGMMLAVVGTLYQALTRNPLADPFLLGVSGGAAVGATLAITLGAGLFTVGSWAFALPSFAAFAGALAALFLVVRLSMVRGKLSMLRLLLVGVVVNFLASAVVMILKTFGGALEVRSLLLWLVGTLSWATPTEVVFTVVVGIVGSLYCFRWMAALNVLSVGDPGAELMGIDVSRVQRHIFFVSSLLVGIAVSVSGLIGFVGLVVPHAMRKIVGPDHRMLLPAAILGGGIFLLLCDVLARLMFPLLGSDAPVGVVTSLVGGPVFLWLLAKDDKGGSHAS